MSRAVCRWSTSLVLLGLLAASADAPAEDSRIAFVRRGIEAYTHALNTESRDVRLVEFRRAEQLFQRATDGGAGNPELFTNLGNAALQSERLGDAILAYRRALLIDPDHPRALQNLIYARSLLPSWVPRPDTGGFLDSFFFWHRALSRAERMLLAAACFAGTALTLAMAVRTGNAAWRNAALLPGLAWLVLIASLMLDPIARLQRAAVVVAPEAVAHAADSALAPSLFPAPLPSGAEVDILEERAPWLRIRLFNGREAWVSASAVQRVGSAG